MKSTPLLSLPLLVSLAIAATALMLPAQPASGQAKSAGFIPPEQAVRHAGESGMVCGKVGKARFAENSEGEPTFLYMGGDFPRHTFTARIQGVDRAKFNPAPETLEGKDVCVVGDIQRDKSRAEIIVKSPSGLKLATIR